MSNTITYEVGVEALQNALKAIYDAESAYKQLLEKSNNEVIKHYFIKKINTVNHFSLTIVSLLQEMNVQPLEKGTVLGGISRLWFDIKSVVVEHSLLAIIEQAKKIEKGFCYVYCMQMRSGIHSEKVHEVLLNQFSEMQALKFPVVLINTQDIVQSVPL